MDKHEEEQAEVIWSQEGDAWIGVFGTPHREIPKGGEISRDAIEVEVLLRAEAWHIELSDPAHGGFEREYVEAADAEEAKAKAANLLRAFRARSRDVGQA